MRCVLCQAAGTQADRPVSGRLTRRRLTAASAPPQRGPDHRKKDQPRAEHEREADRPGEEERRVAAAEDHRAAQVLLEERPEYVAQEERRGLAFQFQENIT